MVNESGAMFDFGLSQEEELIRRTAQAFGEERLRVREREHERSGVPPDLARQYSDLGLSTIDLPQHLGGHGFTTDHPVEKWMRDARTLSPRWGGRDGALGEAGSTLWPAPLSSAQPREAART